MAGVSFLLHVWIIGGAYFHNDDFLYLTWSQEPLGEFLLKIYNNHLMPLEFGVVWISQAIAPFSWTVAVVVLLTMWAALLIGCVLLLRRAFGNSLWTLVALALIGLGPLPAAVSVWYASGLQFLPWSACLVWMLYFAVRDAQEPGRWWWAACAGTYVVSLGFWQKGLFAAPVVLWLVWRYWPGSGRWGLGNLGRRWILPGALVAITLAYLPLYFAVQPSEVLPAKPGADDVLEITWAMIGRVLVPSLFGMPWGSFGQDIDAHIDPAFPWWLSIVLVQVVIAVIVVSVYRWRSAWNAWALMGGYAALTIAVFAWGRFDRYGAILAYDPRYVEDLYIVVALALPFAFARPLGSPLSPPKPLRFESSFGGPVAALIAGVLMLNALVLPMLSVGLLWREYPARQFVESVKATIAANPGAAFVDRKLPGAVMGDFFLEDANLSRVFTALRRPIDWNGAGDRLLAFDDQGRAFEPHILVSSTSVPGFAGSCGYRIIAAPGNIELDTTLFEWIWIGRMEYLAAGSGEALLSMDGPPITVPLREGLNTAWFVIVGKGDTLTLTPPPRVGVCVSEVVLGQVNYEATK